VIDLIYKALAPVLPEEIIAGSSASLSFVSYSGIRPSGDYWVFLEVNEGAYGGRPRSDGPDSIDNLMANTRNNPLEDLAIHLPMICDRYELRDDVLPGAGRYRGGVGVVKSQRVLTDAFITHENERHQDVPWGIFGGWEGTTGKVEIYNVSDPGNVRDMPAKFSGIKINAGDVHAFYAPCGGGYGDPLERPASQVLDDVLDDFCTLEHARAAYGVVVDLAKETVDEPATESLRAQMRSQPPASTSAPERKAQQVAREVVPTQRDSVESQVSESMQPTKSRDHDQTVASAISELRGTFGDNWSFDIVYHTSNRSLTEVRGELRVNGGYASETGTNTNTGGEYSAGKRLKAAAEQSFVRCAQKLLCGT
ncbi:MAG: hydantoinase B/oxoprolinase family protein, partial [Gammaproteobacteria bacterium]|nr:hydantoinase B/oxoprolinase family protein [Gammaproteobacteria bacterium]